MTVMVALTSVSASRVGEQSAKTLILVIVLLVGFRIAGKRELSQLNVYDLAMLVALANGVQNAMTGGLGNLPIGLATSSTIVVAAWVLIRVVLRRPRLERALLGSPTIVVHDGRVLDGRLRAAGLTRAEVAQACRERGVESTEQCQMVVLEVDGSLSVIASGSSSHERTRRRRRRRR